jgi:hypothetical protein
MALNLGGLFKGKVKEVLDSTFKGLDGLITNKEELAKIRLEAEAEMNRHAEAMEDAALKETELVLADKQNAREMFKVNSSLQKIYAIVFLIAYVVLSVAMCWMIYVISVNNVHFPDWGIGFISTIWGAMSMKVGTVTDFLFGASMTPEKK